MPLRIRFWYFVHDQAERLWHWVYRAKIKPWHDAQPSFVPPKYTLVADIPLTDKPKSVEISPGIFVNVDAAHDGVVGQKIYGITGYDIIKTVPAAPGFYQVSFVRERKETE